MIKDSGNRRAFESGAVRDMAEGKGRCDLLPLSVCNVMVMDCAVDKQSDDFLLYLYKFQKSGQNEMLFLALRELLYILEWNPYKAMLELAVHFEEGAVKYGDNNWRKGIPANVYLDSAIRHYCKFRCGMDDERHDRAVLWNVICCIWTCGNKPELNVYANESVMN